jgi:type IV pilus assembly protein PilV
MSPSNGPHRGTTLIEVMVALSVLLIGIALMMRLQIIGLTSNQGARAQMVSVQLGREVLASLERLPWSDPRLAPTAAFGQLLQADGTVVSGAASGADALPGATLDVRLEKDAQGLVYERRWTVRDEGAANSGVKTIAVSVIYRERANAIPREVVLFGGRVNGGLLAANVSAYN